LSKNIVEIEIPFSQNRPRTIKTESVDIEKLNPHPLNASIYDDDDDAIKEMMVSIQTGGVLNKLVVNQDYYIVSGHLRWQAAQQLKKLNQLSDNPSGKFDKVEVDVKEFTEDTLTEEEYLLIANEGRRRTIIQQLHEMERWLEIFNQPKYQPFKKRKHEYIAYKVGLSSNRQYEKALRVLKHIESLREKENPQYWIDAFFKLIKEKLKSLTAIDTYLSKLEKKPSAKQLVEATKEQLDEYSEEFDLGLSIDQFTNLGMEKRLQVYREAVAAGLEIELDEEPETEPIEYTYDDLNDLTTDDLIDVVIKKGLNINIDDYIGYSDPIFFSRVVAAELGIELLPFTAKELISLNLRDLQVFARKHKIKINIKDYDDPLPAYRLKIAEYFNIPVEMIKAELSEQTKIANYEQTKRSLQFGRMEMKINRGEKSNHQIIQVFAGSSRDKIRKLAELIANIHSDNIDHLVAEAKRIKSSSI
jgi:hypothetical protein